MRGLLASGPTATASVRRVLRECAPRGVAPASRRGALLLAAPRRSRLRARDDDEEPDWDREMSIFKQRTMRPNQLATLRELESKVSVGKVRARRGAPACSRRAVVPGPRSRRACRPLPAAPACAACVRGGRCLAAHAHALCHAAVAASCRAGPTLAPQPSPPPIPTSPPAPPPPWPGRCCGTATGSSSSADSTQTRPWAPSSPLSAARAGASSDARAWAPAPLPPSPGPGVASFSPSAPLPVAGCLPTLERLPRPRPLTPAPAACCCGTAATSWCLQS